MSPERNQEVPQQQAIAKKEKAPQGPGLQSRLGKMRQQFMEWLSLEMRNSQGVKAVKRNTRTEVHPSIERDVLIDEFIQYMRQVHPEVTIKDTPNDILWFIQRLGEQSAQNEDVLVESDSLRPRLVRELDEQSKMRAVMAQKIHFVCQTPNGEAGFTIFPNSDSISRIGQIDQEGGNAGNTKMVLAVHKAWRRFKESSLFEGNEYAELKEAIFDELHSIANLKIPVRIAASVVLAGVVVIVIATATGIFPGKGATARYDDDTDPYAQAFFVPPSDDFQSSFLVSIPSITDEENARITFISETFHAFGEFKSSLSGIVNGHSDANPEKALSQLDAILGRLNANPDYTAQVYSDEVADGNDVRRRVAIIRAWMERIETADETEQYTLFETMRRIIGNDSHPFNLGTSTWRSQRNPWVDPVEHKL